MLYNGLSTTSPPSKAQAQPLVKIVPLNPQDPNVRPVTAPKKGIFAAAALSEKLDSASLGKAATTTPRYATKAGDRVHDHVLVRGTGSTSGTTKLGGTVTAVQNQANKALYDVTLDDDRKIEASSVSADDDVDNSLFSEDATSSEGELASPGLGGPHQDEVRLPRIATMGDATAATSVAPSTQAAPAIDYDTDNAATVQPELRSTSKASKANSFKQARQTKREMAAPASARSTPGPASATATATTVTAGPEEVVTGKRKLSEDDSDDSDDDKTDGARASGGNKKKTKIERADGTIIHCEYNIQRLNNINIFPGAGDSRALGDALKTLATSETEGAGVTIGAGGSAPTRLAENYGRGHQALSAEPSSRDLLQAVVAMLSAPRCAGDHGANTMPGLHAQHAPLPPLPPPPPPAHAHAAGFMNQQQAQPGLLTYPTFQEYAPAPPPAPASAPIPAPGVGIGAAVPRSYPYANANPYANPYPNPTPNPNPYYHYPASPMLQHLQPQFQPQVAATNNLNPQAQVFDANANNAYVNANSNNANNANALFVPGAPATPGPGAGPGPSTMQARVQAAGAGAGAYPYAHEYEHAHGHGGQEFEFPGFMSEGEEGDEEDAESDEDAEGEEDDGQYEYVYGYGDSWRTPAPLRGGFPSQM